MGLLLYRPGYEVLTDAEKKNICNGIGPRGIIGDLIPETIWGLKITEAGNIHDFDYYVVTDIINKLTADIVFLVNMYRIIYFESSNALLWFRQNRAINYYKVVLLSGIYFLDRNIEKPVFYWDLLVKCNDYAMSLIKKKQYLSVTYQEINTKVVNVYTNILENN